MKKPRQKSEPSKRQIADAAFAIGILWDSCENSPRSCRAILDLLDHPLHGDTYERALAKLAKTTTISRDLIEARMEGR